MYKYFKEKYTTIYKALNGKLAKDILEKHCIDVVVTDINMPVMCGNDLIKYLVERKQPFIPTIVTSAYEKLTNEYSNLDDCIIIENKPYTMEIIEERIEEILDKSKCINYDLNKIKEATIEAKHLLKLLRNEEEKENTK